MPVKQQKRRPWTALLYCAIQEEKIKQYNKLNVISVIL
jgi:hypothetical protein